MAFSRCAASRRSAARLRRRVMGTRFPASLLSAPPACSAGLAAGFRTAAVSCCLLSVSCFSLPASCPLSSVPGLMSTVFRALSSVPARKSRTSFLVSLSPLAGISSASRPCSLNRFLTAGLSLGFRSAGGDCCRSSAVSESVAAVSAALWGSSSGSCAGSGSIGAASVSGSGAAATACPSVSIWAINSSLTTSSPLFFRIFTSMPSSGATTSRVTLSVSTSIRASPNFTGSPGCLCQSINVASATDSASTGTLTSTSTVLSGNWNQIEWNRYHCLPDPARLLFMRGHFQFFRL